MTLAERMALVKAGYKKAEIDKMILDEINDKKEEGNPEPNPEPEKEEGSKAKGTDTETPEDQKKEPDPEPDEVAELRKQLDDERKKRTSAEEALKRARLDNTHKDSGDSKKASPEDILKDFFS